MSRLCSFLLVVPRVSLPSMLNALSRRGDGKESFWFPVEEEYRALARNTRRANGREEASIAAIAVRVKRGIFYAIVTLDSPTSSISGMFESSSLLRTEMLTMMREAGGGQAILAHAISQRYERLSRPGELLTVAADPSSVDAFVDAVSSLSDVS